MEQVDLGALWRLPRLVAGVGRAAGITGVLTLEGTVVYFLDLEALGRRAVAGKA